MSSHCGGSQGALWDLLYSCGLRPHDLITSQRPQLLKCNVQHHHIGVQISAASLGNMPYSEHSKTVMPDFGSSQSNSRLHGTFTIPVILGSTSLQQRSGGAQKAYHRQLPVFSWDSLSLDPRCHQPLHVLFLSES